VTASNPPPTWRAWIEVDLEALLTNARVFSRLAGAPLLPVVKADAYGLGAVEVVRALELVDPWGYGVATLTEAEELRRQGVVRPVLILSPLLSAEVEGCLAAAARPSIGDLAALDSWLAAGAAPFHIELDTGLARAGFSWHDGDLVTALRARLRNAPGWEGAWCQFHSADTDPPSAVTQWARLRETVAALGSQRPMLHAANSAGGLAGQGLGGDLARPGIYLYGGAVGGHRPVPVVSFHARVVALRRLRAGDTVSYGATWTAPRATTIATIAVGYADGVPMGLSGRGRVVCQGQPCPIVGRVAMDLTMVDVGDLVVEPGDIVTLFGGGVSLDAQASAAGTISYDLLTGIGRRVIRSYREPTS
jgi:alanine racemase